MAIGFEAELHLIDSNGRVAFKADEVLEATRGWQRRPVKEMALNVIEINSFPAEVAEGTVLDYLSLIYKVDEIAQQKDLYLLPMALYPGPYQPQYRTDGHYGAKIRLFGNERAEKWARCTSFHLHYSLPKNKKKIVLLYNLAVALVPVFDALFQSSPYYQGKFLAKDSRAVIYRDFEYNGIKGAYYGLEFGGYAHYVESWKDLMTKMRIRKKRLQSLLRNIEYEGNIKASYWGTVRLNTKGTVELRSPDVILPSYLLEGLQLYNMWMEKTEDLNTWELTDEPRVYIDDETLYLPSDPISLSYKAIFDGLANDDVHTLVDSAIRNGDFPVFKQMWEERQTFSDQLMTKAGKMVEYPEELALEVAEKMLKEMDYVKKRAERLFADIQLFRHPQPFILEWLQEEHPLPVSHLGDISKLKVLFISPLLNKRIQIPRVKIIKIGFDHGDVVVDRDEWVGKVAGIIGMWKNANQLSRDEVGYYGITNEEATIISPHALFITRLDLSNDLRDKADLLVKSLDELEMFLKKP